MKIYSIKNKKVKVGVTEECGHLHPVQFFIDNKIIEPLNIAPWTDDNLDDSSPPMLKLLRGDFFCAPFGASDLLEDESRPHGTTANGSWELISKNNDELIFKLHGKISGAEVIKKISLNNDHPVVYQEHQLISGDEKIPLGHHLMLKVPEKIHLSFSEYLFGETPPNPVEPDPEMGFSILKYPQRFTDLTAVKLFDENITDFSVYPSFQYHEDLLMLKSDESLPFAWSAASAPESGWLWFSIKNPRDLKYTVLWYSNGGRKYPPFSSRHKNVIGIEEVTSFFHLGHKASIEKNHLSEEGFSTFVKLEPGKNKSLRYAFGLVPIPPDFKKVNRMVPGNNEIDIYDENEKKVNVKFNLDFIKENNEEN
jgi:hypothetical protein